MTRRIIKWVEKERTGNETVENGGESETNWWKRINVEKEEEKRRRKEEDGKE